MPATIVLSHLSWSTPDGRLLFDDLDLTLAEERVGLVGRNGVGKTTLVRLIAHELAPTRGSVRVEGTLAVLGQVVAPAPGESVADLFGAREALSILERAERGEASEHDLARADWTLEARIGAALARVDLSVEPQTLLAALSGGQRTRAGLAALLIEDPDWLLLDEPTNNLDRAGREAVLALLAEWRAGAIVVSHDRELLEVMDSTVELTSKGAKRYGGGWSRYRELKALELEAASRQAEDAEKRLAQVDRAAQAGVERQARRDSVGRRKADRGGAPKIVLGVMKRRSEETAGEAARNAERRRAEASEAAAQARAKLEVLQPFTVALAPTRLPPGRTVLELTDVSVGYAPGRPVLRGVSLTVSGPERIAVTGPNGAGKTTLLELIGGRLLHWSGSVRVPASVAYLDQSVSLIGSEGTIRDAFRTFNPDASENACRAALARFMFRADAVLQTASTLSGGQRIRAGLACVLGGPSPPELLLLDEPTNHLDLDSIQAVEAGLMAYDGALVVVSHDAAFLDSLGLTRRVELG